MVWNIRVFAGLLAMLGIVAHGQPAGELFAKAPPDVDQALRVKVAEYYKLQVDRKFRVAESLVCVDSRDRYYDMEKRAYSKAEFIKIIYEPGFKEAKVVYSLGMEMNMPQGRLPVVMPITTMWKLEEGNWCYFIPDLTAPGAEVETPFGKMKVGEAGTSGGIPTFDPTKLPANFSSDVKLSQQMVKLPSDRPATATVEVQNNVAGPVQLWLDAREYPGLTLQLSEKSLAKDGKAILTIDWKPPKGKAKSQNYSFKVIVEPFTKALPIYIEFQPGSEGTGPKTAATAKPAR